MQISVDIASWLQLTCSFIGCSCRSDSKARGLIHMDTLNKQFKTTLAKQFGKYENGVRINTFVDNLVLYIQKQDQIVYKREDLIELINSLGLKRVFKQMSEIELNHLLQSLSRFCLMAFFYVRSIEYNLTFQTQAISFQKDGYVEAISASANPLASMASTLTPAMNHIVGSKVTRENHNIVPSLKIQYTTGVDIVDEYIKNSLILNHYYEKTDLSVFQKFQIQSMAAYLSNSTLCLRNIMKSLNGTQFMRGEQNIMNDYIQNLINNNQMIRKQLCSETLIPYCIELNGVAGIGKSTFVELLAKLMQTILPFYSSDRMVYSRVNDKFWNGYTQQPIILYDDSNQNEKMLFNLDNEIIAIGSGQLVHPPMAFEKNTKFSSIFVVYTTNTPLIETTHADKGAISRRVHTVKVTPKSYLGSFTIDNFGEKWRYHPNIKKNVYNIEFDGESANYVLNCFFNKMIGQIDAHVCENIFDDDFEEVKETLSDAFSVNDLLSFIDEQRRQKLAEQFIGQQVIDDSVALDEERRKQQELLEFRRQQWVGDRGKVRIEENLSQPPNDIGNKVAVTNSYFGKKTKLTSLHQLLNSYYYNMKDKTMYSVIYDNLKISRGYNGNLWYIQVRLTINGVANYFTCNGNGNFESKYAKSTEILAFLPVIENMLNTYGDCSCYKSKMNRSLGLNINKAQLQIDVDYSSE